MRSELDLAWLAGVIDGEGTITINRRKTPTSIRYQPRLLVTNTNFALIQKCREIVGRGYVYQGHHDRISNLPANWNAVHRFQVCSAQAREIITAVRPYLVAKAAHADIVLSMPTRSRNHRDTSAIPAQEIAFTHIAALNRRGRHSLAST